MSSVKEKVKVDSSEKWDLNPLRTTDKGDFFSADEVIDAYFQGKKNMLTEIKQTVADHFEKNLNVAKDESVLLLDAIISKGFKCQKILLKSKDLKRFNALFQIDEKDWCADGFDEIYQRSIEVKNKVNNDDFDYSVIFMPSGETTDNRSLNSDGYILSYDV